MSTPNYDALVLKLRDWSNRDEDTLPDSVIEDALEYASEEAYRELRIQGMEKIYKFTADQNGNSFKVPSDLKEYISLRQLSTANEDVAGTETFSFTAEAGQSLFSGVDNNSKRFRYTPHALLVTLNGVFLTPTADYVAENGLSLTLLTPAYSQDILNVVAFNSIVDSASVASFEYTATVGQTEFTGLDDNNETLAYKLNRVLVTKNGIYLVPGVDFTANDKVKVTLATGAIAGDEIVIVSFNETSVYSSQTSNIEIETIVYDNRADYRTFMSDSANKYSSYLWTRQADQIVINPKFSKGDVFELYYYSDGSDLGTEYEVTSSNFQAGLLEESTLEAGGSPLYFLSSVTDPIPNEDVPSNNQGGDYTATFYFKGTEKPHYLRDNQERLLLYYALSFVNDYLGEDKQSEKYFSRASNLIMRLNNAEVFKQSSGGNVRINFDGPLI